MQQKTPHIGSSPTLIESWGAGEAKGGVEAFAGIEYARAFRGSQQRRASGKMRREKAIWR
jgi:hypothetical protein